MKRSEKIPRPDRSDFRAALGQAAGVQAQAVEADGTGRIALVEPALHSFHRRDLDVESEYFDLRPVVMMVPP